MVLTVVYESPSRFSREHRRALEVPPKRQILVLRARAKDHAGGRVPLYVG
jgi:hypothetical protein